MRGLQRPSAIVAAAGVFLAVAIGVYVTYGVGGLLVLALAGPLVGSYVVNRHVAIPLDGHYPRHGDRMD
jgi:hypothetical protein